MRSKHALLIGRGFNGLEQFGPDMKKFIETYGELAVINLIENTKK
ncbi:hypothetical protein [Thermaurantimonas sp.]